MTNKHILIAFDKFKDCMSAQTACDVTQKILETQFPENTYESAPLTDGGEGFCEILTLSAKGELTTHQATSTLIRGSTSSTNEVHYGTVKAEALTPQTIDILKIPPTAQDLGIIEMSQASGLESVPNEERNPWNTTSYGTGEQLALCSDKDALLLGVGGSATNDLGIGALQALGLKAFDKDGAAIKTPLVPSLWKHIHRLDKSQLIQLPPIRIACDVRNPLLGEQGCSAIFGPQKGLTQGTLPGMEAELKRLAHMLCELFKQPISLLDAAGSGAAGGIACGLSIAYGAELVEGFPLVEAWLQLENKLSKADILITGEGAFDESSLSGKGPFSLLQQAKPETDIYIFAGIVQLEPSTLKELNIKNAYSIGKKNWPLKKNLAEGKALLSLSIETRFQK